MEEKNCEEEIQLRCEELQEIIGRKATFLERYGIIVMSVVVLLVIVFSYFFQYPDTLEATVTITNSTPAIDIVAKTGGNLLDLPVKNGERVKAHSILGVVQNAALTQDVLAVEELMKDIYGEMIDEDAVYQWMNSHNLQLGELQNSYNVFKNSCFLLHDFLELDYYPKKLRLQKRMQDNRQEQDSMLKELFSLTNEQTLILRQKYQRDSVLFTNNRLSKEEYESSRNSYLQSLQTPISNVLSDKQAKLTHIQDEGTLLDMTYQFAQTLNEYKSEYNNARDQLGAAIKQWENAYVMRTPIDGIVNLVGVWSVDQFVNAGQVVCVIMPIKMADPVGKALLPADGVGKLKIGQSVMIGLSNYPEEEFGTLVGKVNSIPSVPTAEGLYVVDIEFPDGMNTVFGTSLPNLQQMIGQARIIVDRRRLLEIVTKPIEKLFKSQEYISTLD